MINHRSGQLVDMRGRVIPVMSALSIALSATTVCAQQQAPPTAAPVQQTVPPAPEPAPSNPGLVEEFGKLLKDSASGLTSKLPTPGQALEGLTSGTKDASDGLKRIAPLSGQTMVAGRTICPPAPNGAPDCKAAADQLCKGKGYAAGSVADIESTEKCSAKSYFTGQGACRTENFVTRAFCQ